MQRLLVLVCLLALSPATVAEAGPYTDRLTKCLVESTTPEDHVDLVRWLYASLSLHPAVKSMASVSPEERETANQRMGALVTRLLSDACGETAMRAIQYEGAETLETSFNILGQVAGQELLDSPAVAASMSGLEEHIDGSKLEHLFAGESAKN